MVPLPCFSVSADRISTWPHIFNGRGLYLAIGRKHFKVEAAQRAGDPDNYASTHTPAVAELDTHSMSAWLCHICRDVIDAVENSTAVCGPTLVRVRVRVRVRLVC